MRRSSVLTLIAVFGSIACDDPECRSEEIKIGKTCYPSPRTDAAADDDLDGGSSELPRDGSAAKAGADSASAVTADGSANEDAALGRTPGDTNAASDAAVRGDAEVICSPAHEICDGADNDCDGIVDNGFSKGVSCTVGVGECAATGILDCDAHGAVACSATPTSPTVEVCDGKDNDCDSIIDNNPRAVWYRDCDGDGFAASAANSVTSCTSPALSGTCQAWTMTAPAAGATDCNDADPAYKPGADYGVADDGNSDRNCDGIVEYLVRVVRAPATVLFTPPAGTPFCSSQANIGCECFVEQRPLACAKVPTDTVNAGFQHAYALDSKGNPTTVGVDCQAAITPATSSADIYTLLQTCR